MAESWRMQCSQCPFTYCLVLGREQQAADGKTLVSAHRWCYHCNKVTERQFTPIEEMDPDLHKMLFGNTGRILRYLTLHGPLLFGKWPSGEALPSPRRIGKVSKPLVLRQLVRITDEGVFLEEGVLARIERWLSIGKCPLCATPYLDLQQCPECGGEVRITEMGRCD